MARAIPQSIVAVLALAAALTGCAAGPLVDSLPSSMGLPADAPARPVTPYQYPAVHDMPPARSTPTMSEDEQMKLEKDLAAIRDRQEGRPAPAKKATTVTKKQPATGDNAATDGAKTSGAKTNP